MAAAGATDILESTSGEPTCFLCPWEETTPSPCDLATLTGELRDAIYDAKTRRLDLTIRTASGETAHVFCAEQGRVLWRELAAYPPERWQGLRVAIHHLARASAPGAWRLLPAGVIVLEPDLLLNITDINNAEYCVRQYPLRRMVPSPPSAASLRGTLVHTAFKELLKGGDEPIEVYLRRALAAARVDLALRQISEEEMADEAAPHVRALATWYASSRQTLWGATPPEIRAETFLLAPEVGLKGRLDVLLQDGDGGSLLELKTGAVRTDLPKREHRWQVHGYQTLLAARFGRNTRLNATLLYSGTPGSAESRRIPFILRDLHRVLELRNALALVHATGAVPPPPSPAKCARCMLRHDCVRASRLLGWQPPDLADASERLPFDGEDAALFAEMYSLLREEARASEDEGSALWRETAEQRAQRGVALDKLTVDGEPRQTERGEWEYTFRGAQGSDLREGDAVLVSDGDPVRSAVVSGSILRIEPDRVVVWTPERIAHPTLLDRYESDIVQNRTVRNLWRWLDGSPHLRALVRGVAAPTFDAEAEAALRETLPDSLNAEQRQAVARALSAREYLLIQGPPGTGKTSVVAEIARRAMQRGERVLVAAFTNQAVDTVLRRLLADGWDDFVRLGHELSVAPEIQGHRLVARARALAGDRDGSEPSPSRIRETLRTAPLVAATTATWSSDSYDDVGEPLLFDLAILDEATQLTLPATLGALRFVRRFVLVGDDRQLPPLVRSETAADRGLKRSLFATLLDRWGEAASAGLRRQYRMHPVICAFPSGEFYDGALVAEGAARTEVLSLARPIPAPYTRVLDPARPIVFIDTPLEPHERGRKESRAQATVIHNLVQALRAAGVAAADMGVIAPYRAQVAAIRAKLAASGEMGVLVDTVDRFQGGERSVIFYSFGGGGAAVWGGRGPEFLADVHRLNVALTRARRKLIILGSRALLEEIPLLARLVAYCGSLYDGHGGIIPARPTNSAARAEQPEATPSGSRR